MQSKKISAFKKYLYTLRKSRGKDASWIRQTFLTYFNATKEMVCLSNKLSLLIRLLLNYLFCIHPLHTPHLFHQEKKERVLSMQYLSMERCEPQYNKLNINCKNRDRRYVSSQMGAKCIIRFNKKLNKEERCTCYTQFSFFISAAMVLPTATCHFSKWTLYGSIEPV